MIQDNLRIKTNKRGHLWIQGAATTCYAALHPQLKGISGQYFADSNLSKASGFAQDPELANKLWDFISKLTQSK